MANDWNKLANHFADNNHVMIGFKLITNGQHIERKETNVHINFNSTSIQVILMRGLRLVSWRNLGPRDFPRSSFTQRGKNGIIKVAEISNP